MIVGEGGEEQPESGAGDGGGGGVGGRDAAVNYKTRKRPVDATAVYTITGGDTNQLQDVPPPWSSECALPAAVLDGNGPQRRRPRTWTCGGGAAGGVSSLTRSRTFTSNERGHIVTLWQPYECRSSSNSLNDDGDVAVWLSATGRYEPLSSRSSLSLSTIPRSAGSCSSSVCRLLDDGGGDKTPPPPPCWCTAETEAVLGDPHNDVTARTTTGYRCPPRGSLLQRRGIAAAAAAAVEGERPVLRSRPDADVQSNVQRPTSRVVPSRCVSAGDWCCDNGDVDVDDDDDDDEDEDYYCVYEDETLRRVDNDVDVGDDNRVRAVVPMDNGSGLITGGAAVVGLTADGGKPQAAAAAERTYASTEAQTDETACSSAYREQRRRERRERRLQQQRRVHPPPPPPPALSSSSLLPPPPPTLLLQQQQSAIAVPVDQDRLPDLLLNSHLPPPLYTTVGGGGVCDVAMATRAANLQASLLPAPFQHPHQPSGAPVGSSGSAVNSPGGFRLPFGIIPARRRRSLHYCSEEDTPKSCCGLLTLPDATSTVSIRWFIGIVFIAGICSALVGTVLGATRASGREHLTVALLMIGVGVILVAISGIAWRLTAGQEASSCGAVFGLGRSLDDAAEANRRFVPRLPPSYGRPHHPYAAMMYPEFEYRAPPPSYQASMQEYRLRLLLLDRQTNMPPVTASPPPTYRSQPGTLIRGQNVCCRGDSGELYLYQPSTLQINHHQTADYSGPPSYRSRSSTLRPGCHLMMDPTAGAMVIGSTAVGSHHSRNSSQLSAAMSEAVGGGVLTATAVDNKVPPPPNADDDGGDGGHVGIVVGSTVDDNVRNLAVVVDEKTADCHHIGCGPVTIVQTTPAANPPGTVIVTVSSANNDTTNVRCRDTEMEILAHL
ncbi:LOW QUALITY PROTEIN: uncharacterized protein LOC112603683 [Melanaphis sacchari]|uniref:LOW QUALITY PROTEIN: uncharacterized protein LOC112603683 n=1 Tax=Melanaphis sacchari TaxID=742174 RepID=UPI000DC1407B|nr:LOW QUALITY PROTEIN: uncharacterized protein LOC112603683 [Melanaphis sacchari]